jgi:L-serine dehydratase
MNSFDIIGPVMVGPSSSHTAGAVRIGLIARALADGRPVRATIGLHGSFARTWKGHGTDKAIVAGLLGFHPDDERIRTALQLARAAGLTVTFRQIDLPGAHPNTAVIELACADGQVTVVRGASTGGGRIVIESVNNLDVSFSGDYPTLVISHHDTPGIVAAVTRQLSDRQINIANMKVFRSYRGGIAVMVIETDQPIGKSLSGVISAMPGIRSTALILPVID